MELLELMNKEERTNQDIFDFYQVENKQELLNILEMRILEGVKENISYIYGGFGMIYDETMQGGYNPLKERIMFYTMFLAAFYGFDIGESELFMSAVGPYLFVKELDDIFKSSDIESFYRNLYNQYKEEKNTLINGIREVGEMVKNTIIEFIDSIEDGSIDKLISDITNKLEDFKETLNK